ncbi:hypothetical protein K461DRAFT_264589 [Myriangium duriaei CBS 260.36]|uniref:Uncharacterized protein n=1 Tax=Myriangium duriaei CBS 260.36 TaxID=1168546 RepID=A0A9P4J9V7_9PEZI|nr:hypothetical protein K461DRAFT_264589 [Myriangium duriaei CBS 260.36]
MYFQRPATGDQAAHARKLEVSRLCQDTGRTSRSTGATASFSTTQSTAFDVHMIANNPGNGTSPNATLGSALRVRRMVTADRASAGPPGMQPGAPPLPKFSVNRCRKRKQRRVLLMERPTASTRSRRTAQATPPSEPHCAFTRRSKECRYLTALRSRIRF